MSKRQKSKISKSPSEDNTFREDIEDLPNEGTLQDYERMSISPFGAALVRVMGKPESLNIVKPWLLAARPTMRLGPWQVTTGLD